MWNLSFCILILIFAFSVSHINSSECKSILNALDIKELSSFYTSPYLDSSISSHILGLHCLLFHIPQFPIRSFPSVSLCSSFIHSCLCGHRHFPASLPRHFRLMLFPVTFSTSPWLFPASCHSLLSLSPVLTKCSVIFHSQLYSMLTPLAFKSSYFWWSAEECYRGKQKGFQS